MVTSGGWGDGSKIAFSGACGETKHGNSSEFAANVTENPSVLDRRSNVERPDDDDQP